MRLSMQTTIFVFLLIASLLFHTGDSDKCHRNKGVCKLAVGGTCMGASRANECRYPYYRCCYPPRRGKRRKRHTNNLKEKLT